MLVQALRFAEWSPHTNSMGVNDLQADQSACAVMPDISIDQMDQLIDRSTNL
jgi:hypothetical protein